MNFAINEYYNYRWCIGKNYYYVKGWFVNRGYRRVDSECIMHVEDGWGIGVLDNGTSKVYIKTELYIRQSSGHLNCGKVLDVKEQIYD